jgi:outer membrane protein insertion porin family
VARGLETLLVLACVSACGAPGRRVANPGTAAEQAVCAGEPIDERLGADARAVTGDDLARYEGWAIMGVELGGAATLDAQLRPGITLRVGDRLDGDAVAAELRRLWQLGLVDDAVARAVGVAGGVKVELEVRERGVIGAVGFDRREGWTAADEPRLRRLRSLAGVIDDPGRIRRTARRLEDELRTAGHWKALVTATRRRGEAGQVAVCVVIEPGQRYRLAPVEFPGAARIPATKLAALIAHDDGAINAAGGAYRADLLDLDLLRIQAEYFDVGHVEVRVGTPVSVVDERQGRIRLTIPVKEGAQYRVGEIRVTGVDATTAAGYARQIRLRAGAVFVRRTLAEDLEAIRAAEVKAGRSGMVTPLTHLDAERATIGLTIEVTP